MPEIKHHFARGKMNKDLDERLIPNGQYRDAMNIQVSTSEGSDVGTVQNILGNYEVPGQSLISDEAFCVGSISDEKNDKLYWFVLDGPGPELITNGNFDTDSQDWVEGLQSSGITTNFNALPNNGWSYDSGNESILATDVEKFQGLVQKNVNITPGKTYVIKFKISNFSGTGDISPVIVDENGIWTRPGNVHGIAGMSYFDYRDYVATDDGEYEYVLTASTGGYDNQEVAYTPPGWTPYQPNQIYFQNRAETDSQASGYASTNLLNCNIDNVSVRTLGASYIFQYDTKTNKVIPVFVDSDNSVLKLNKNHLITGVNIIDDMLFWTDNNSEPKKINIKRSIDGTSPSGNIPTYIINPKQNIDYFDRVLAKEHHLTVIKPAPKKAPNIETLGFRDDNLMYTGVVKISENFSIENSLLNSSIGKLHDFSFLKVGDTFSTIIDTDINNTNNFNLEWNVGDSVVLKEFNEDGVPPETPILDYTIKGTITDWGLNSFTNSNFLLTKNGGMTDGSGNAPDEWDTTSGGFNNSNRKWNWDSVNHKLTCNGTNSAINSKIWNSNTNRDIVDGGKYKIKYTISPPEVGDITGSVTGRLFSADPANIGTSNDGDGYFINFASEETNAGEYEHEITFDASNQWTWGNNSGEYLNSILFESKSAGQTLGANIVSFLDSSVSANEGQFFGFFPTFVLPGDPLHPGGASAFPVPNTWQVGMGSVLGQEVTFDHANLNANWTGTTQSAYLYNVQNTDLEIGEDYELTITVSNATFNGGNWQAIGVRTQNGASGATNVGRVTTGAVAQNTSSDPWNGLGGQVTQTFTATASGRIDLKIERSGGLSTTEGPKADIFVSLRKVANPGFNGSISNVSVEELDETVARVEIKVDSIDGTPENTREGQSQLKYAIDLFQEDEEKLFENKFSRFAYRYKYLDGECSPISPFSNVIFSPSTFDYHPKKGHNLGMFNNIKTLRVRDYNKDLPADVSGIDILYKEENSPNIYIVDSVKDFSTQYSSYEIKAESIRGGALPSNQLLRPWDNVPRKALAQEIVGNRVVYGNYLQNYNLVTNNGSEYKVEIELGKKTRSNNSRIGEKSVKSLRDYQVGVVFGDEYGRETPILTTQNATTKVNKINASTINELSVEILNREHPVNMKYFKFFVKDTGGDYYNLAMDRYYDAKDGNIWLAFPSTDRNKIDIDDYLILKKGIGTASKDVKTGEFKGVIKEKAQYKVLDIKNEAPDYIKRKETLIASVKHEDNDKFFKDNDLPAFNDINFSIAHNKISSASYAKLHEDFGKDTSIEYYISLSNTDTNLVTDRYKIIELHGIEVGGTPTWYFTLEKPFNSEINDFTNDESGVNSTKIIDNTYLNIYKTAVDNSASYKFDGRFFVKIYNDDIFTKALKDPVSDVKPEYKSTGVSRKIYSLKTDSSDPNSNRIEKLGPQDGRGPGAPEAFKGIQTRTDSDGLNTGVCSVTSGTFSSSVLANREKFSWRNYNSVTNNFGSNLGTLNEEKRTYPAGANSASVITKNQTNRHTTVWRDYDAYFRGVNVYLNNNALAQYRIDAVNIAETNENAQKFQDVWFIDDARHNGSFPYSKRLGGDEFWRQDGWKTLPSTWRKKSYGIRSWGTGDNGTSQIELAFGGIQPVKWIEGKDNWQTDPSFFDLENQNTNYSEREKDFIEKIAIGSQFRFKEDPNKVVYTITAVDNIYKIRYENLSFYNGPFEPENYSDYNKGQLRPTHLAPVHAQALAGKASGMQSTDETIKVSNVMGAQSYEQTNNHTKIEGVSAAESAIYKTNTFLRPSNYTRNWRIKVDKAINDHWNPVEDTNTEISNSAPITVTSSGDGTKNTVKTTDIKGGGTNENRLSVGMVLKSYIDSNDSNNVKTLSPPAIVTKITESSGTHTIYLKTYDGSEDFAAGTAGGTMPGGVQSGDTLNFYQYPMNGLSPNAAKNLNFFRDGKGTGDTKAGTDAVGYTIEFVEEKSARSEEEILPENPAIWETKPKDLETKDLDIYHEASGHIPIYAELTKDNIHDLIPIGSIVEHEGSDGIPWNTTVVDVDPVTERIILSKAVQVEEMSAGQIYLAWLQSFGWTPGTIPVNYGGGGGKIICTELCEQGYITKEVLDLDYRHSDNNMDLATKVGYWKWATPIVNLMRKSSIFTQVVRPFGVAWAHEMAHREEPTKYSGNILGKLLMLIGVPLCRYIGKKEIIKNNIQA